MFIQPELVKSQSLTWSRGGPHSRHTVKYYKKSLRYLEPDLHVLQSHDFFKGIYLLIQDQETRGYILEENQRIRSFEYILWFSPILNSSSNSAKDENFSFNAILVDMRNY
ncbi:hypothetical protein BpHYR1_026632 [Brachionus plicatilis]|uniref:Uncharacterized protein n=1 Tax=Brachionus plicatilis TaxID=10195 RepID=A0A3M7PB29_BRAPC|nr:hypothetical protein BpHYR1_026632 [Brachionus plicatilis]